MIETRKGLPNTCSRCGNAAGATWFAASEDAARSGQGLCATCAKETEMQANETPDIVDPENGPVAEVPAEAAEGPDATDAARELAGAEGVDLASVRGTGQGGRITKGDVESALSERDAE